MASLQGRVLDENGLPVKDAAVTSGTSAATTDVDGVFKFTNIQLSSRFGFVKVAKQGYFTGSRSILTNAGSSNFVTINLLARASKGSFSASAGGVIVVQTGDTVIFDPASLVTASSGAVYSGTVHVYAAYLDPTDPNLSKQMPGDLRGIGKDGKETGLQTYGMMVVEMDGDGGEKLQISPGKQAYITMAIPPSLRASAPSSMPLWYFNDTTGRWIEEGIATRKKDNLCGNTNHFSFWNFDAPYPLTNFKVYIKDQHGNPVAYTQIKFSSEGNGRAFGNTDSSGFATGLIPVGKALLMEVLNPCGATIYQQSVGPVLNDQDLGTITVQLDLNSLTLKGTVVDCSNSPVAGGFINAQVDGLNYRAVISNGAFSMPVLRCSSSATDVTLTAVDQKTQEAGKTTVSVKSGTQDLGQLSACGNPADQFVSVVINGTTYNWSSPPDNINYEASPVRINATQSGGNNELYVANESAFSGLGNIDFVHFQIRGDGANFGSTTLYSSSVITHFNITTFSPVGGYFIGTLNGDIYDSIAKKSYPLAGSMKLKRTN